MTERELEIKNVGKQDPKRHLGEQVRDLGKDYGTLLWGSLFVVRFS